MRPRFEKQPNFPCRLSVPYCISLNGMQKQFNMGLISSKKANKTMLKSLSDLHGLAVYLSLLHVRVEVKPQRILEISGRRNACEPCCFPSRGVFSMSAGCVEVCAPGLLRIKATCLCFSFLQACHTCSSHTGTPLS